MRILLLEDEETLAAHIRTALEAEGYVVDHASDGEDGAFLGETEPYDLGILDLGLPYKDGVSVLRDWRSAGIQFPIIILSARETWSDRVAGIDAGADDYMVKPFQMEELLARVRAQLRRASGQLETVLTHLDVALDTRSNRVSKDGITVTLTAQELRVLKYLMMHRDKTISRTELTEHIYDQDFDRDSNTIEVFVGRLRKKLGSDLIKTVRGLGYRLGDG